MKFITSIIVISLLSCGVKDSKFVRKKIGNNEITIRWYYYSYITSISPDLIVIEKGNEKMELYKAKEVIADISLKEHNVVIKVVHPEKGIVYTKSINEQVFGYRILIDTSENYNDLILRPDGVKEGE